MHPVALTHGNTGHAAVDWFFIRSKEDKMDQTAVPQLHSLHACCRTTSSSSWLCYDRLKSTALDAPRSLVMTARDHLFLNR